MTDEQWVLNQLSHSSNSIALDIGANVGEWSKVLCSTFSNVIAIEPDPRAFQELQLLQLSNLTCKNIALSFGDSDSLLYMRPNSVQSSLLKDHPIGAHNRSEAPIIDTHKITTLTLDSLVKQYSLNDIGFIKIDVEGFEGNVLSGATDPMFENVDWLIEIHDTEKVVLDQLKRLGYGSQHIQYIRHISPIAHPHHFWMYVKPERNEI